jgi:deoxyribodipyrimidine photo-lyase
MNNLIIDERRIRYLNDYSNIEKGPIVYWMNRDQRVEDNWALLHAQALSFQHNQPIIVVFCVAPNFLGATLRQYDFMIKGLQEIEGKLKKYNISFILLKGVVTEELPKLLSLVKAQVVVTDFSPIKFIKGWKNTIASSLTIPLIEVDAHNIVPCWVASHKAEFSAYTLRLKISRILMDFLTEYPKLLVHPFAIEFELPKIDWPNIFQGLSFNKEILPAEWIKPGEDAALKCLSNFIDNNLHSYSQDRNLPTKDAQSNLSPYLHFGQISAQRIALEISKIETTPESKAVFLEELIIRRELSDNFCFYNDNYDNFSGFPNWAQESLMAHLNDPRANIYTQDEFETAATLDPLWNAAQNEMRKTGKMHGYMRMYWAKKILEWTNSPEDALKIAIYLNDKYELDGRDANGYAGIAWCIGGLHDRPWFDRPIYGKIRYMNYNGCKRKFDIATYISKYPSANQKLLLF